MAEASFELALRELSQAQPDEFALVRSRLEKELSAAGDKEAAAELRRRRRPHLAAWACNQLSHLGKLDELFSATAAVAAAQQDAVRGKGADELREQTRTRQELLDELATEAVGALRGVTPKPETYRDNIVATLDAASVDPEAAEGLRSGLLTQALRAPAGFNSEVAAVTPARTSAPATKTREVQRERQRARKELDQARAEHTKLAGTADEASAEQASAEMQAETTNARLSEMEEALSRARENARAAAGQATAARKRGSESRRAADEAAERLRRAEARLRELET